jgi:hypothetical protein
VLRASAGRFAEVAVAGDGEGAARRRRKLTVVPGLLAASLVVRLVLQ